MSHILVWLVSFRRLINLRFQKWFEQLKFFGDRNYKKVYLKAKEVNSPAPRKLRKLDCVAGLSTPRPTPSSASELQPRQLTYHSLMQSRSNSALPIDQNHPSNCAMINKPKRPLDVKQQELTDNLTMLKVQLESAHEELNKLNQQDKDFKPLTSIHARLRTICHGSGHTKTTCTNDHCTSIKRCTWETSWF